MESDHLVNIYSHYREISIPNPDFGSSNNGRYLYQLDCFSLCAIHVFCCMVAAYCSVATSGMSSHVACDRNYENLLFTTNQEDMNNF